MILEEYFYIGQHVVFTRDVRDLDGDLAIEAGATAEIIGIDRPEWNESEEQYPLTVRMLSGRFNASHKYFTDGGRISTNPFEVTSEEECAEPLLDPGSLDFPGLMEALYG